ncbi:MAG: efflux RND transporter periplasmic adaptor subunit [Myxococcota bacterium]
MSDQLSNDLASLKISRDAKPPTAGWVKPLVIVVLVAGGLGAAWVYGKPYLESRVFKEEVEATQIVTISPSQAQSRLTSSGYVVPQRVSSVGSKIPGRIKKIHVEQGGLVQEGDLIAELEGADQRAAIRSAKARVLLARAQVKTAKAEVAETEHQAKRSRGLAQRGFGGAAEAEDLEMRAKILRQRVGAAEANVRAMQAEVAALEVGIEYLTVTAPMTGTVITKPAEVGELVGLQAASIVQLADFDSLLVESDVPEGRLHLVPMNGPAEVVLDAFPTERYRGRVVGVSPRVDRAKATVTVKIEFVDPVEKALPDMAARVSFLEEPLDVAQMDQPSKVVVPSAAIDERDGAMVVWVLEDEQVRMRPITIGDAVGPGFELVDGPPPGTLVVREPSAVALRDGQRVKQRGET